MASAFPYYQRSLDLPDKRALIVGIDSLIGHALSDTLLDLGWKVDGTSRRITEKQSNVYPFDLSRLDRIEKLPPCDHIFLCAAMTKYSDCRKDPELARIINVEAPVSLARHFSVMGSHVVFLSTSAVFDGTIPLRSPDSPICPVTDYGRTKAEAEKLLMKTNGAVGILRLSKVLVASNPLFKRWISSLRAGEKIFPFYDMFMAPITLDLVVDMLVRIALLNCTGIYQISALEDVSYYDGALYLAARILADTSLVIGQSALEKMIPSEELPRFTGLDSGMAMKLVGKNFPDSPLCAIDSIISYAI